VKNVLSKLQNTAMAAKLSIFMTKTVMSLFWWLQMAKFSHSLQNVTTGKWAETHA